MKKFISIFLTVIFLSYLGVSAFAMENNFEKEEIVSRLEEKYGAKLMLNDSISLADLYDIEACLEESFRTSGQLPFGPGVTVIGIEEAINGTSNYHWTSELDTRIQIPGTTSAFNVRGTLHILATITKNTVNGLVYLSGSVTDCYIIGQYLGSMRFLYGDLGIQSNGTRFPSVRANATVLFEVPVGAGSQSFNYTFYSNTVEIFAPD